MSWVVEEWKEGLPTKTLQKIQELESQLDKLKKDRQQRQFQLESLEAAFQKQKQKVDSEKGEVVALRRENQSLIELCDNNDKMKQKLTHDYQMKETQVNFLEGQMSSSKKQIEKLEQELKRYKNDLERSQQSFNVSDMSLCATPQKNCATFTTPNKYNDSKYEELEEKYNKEVEERRRIENELKMLQLKNVNQPSQTQSTMNHRDIARHQASSSVFSWQQDRTPSRTSHNSHETTLKRTYASSQCSWDQEETPSKRGFKPDNSNKSFCDSYNNQVSDQLRVQNQELRSKINEMEIRLQVQEKDLKNQLNKFQETQILLEKTQMELLEKDKELAKSRDDLARMTRQFEQSVDKCNLSEQKLKKVSEELSCQRQNAESARITVEQKLKEREKENQQELSRQQSALQTMEQQLNQIQNKLSQESQQAKNDFNSIQSELDKATQAKKLLEIDTEELKQKLCKTQKALQESQSKESDCKRLLEEAKSAQNAIKGQYDQKSKETHKLEEEFKSTNETLRHNLDEIKNKHKILEEQFKSATQNSQVQECPNCTTLKATLSNLEKEKDFAQELLKKREFVLSLVMEENDTLKKQCENKGQECIELGNRKNEQEKVNAQVCNEKDLLLKKMNDLEMSLQSQVHLLETEKIELNNQIKTLQNIVDVKTADLLNEKNAFNELQRALDAADQKFKTENDNLVLKISDLRAKIEEQKSSICLDQVSGLEHVLQKEKQLNFELQRQCEDLLKNKAEVQERLTESQENHEHFVIESTSQLESLQNNVSSKQNYIETLESAIKEKENEISALSNKLRITDTDIQSTQDSNTLLRNKIQELNLHSESWSVEKEKLATLISSTQRDIESLTNENKRISEVNESLNYEKTQLLKANIDLNHILQERERTISEMVKTKNDDDQLMLDDSRINSVNKFDNMKLESVYKDLENKNEQLLKANKELVALVDSLQNNELSLNKVIEELRSCLKDAVSKPNKIDVLQMDLDEKDVCMENSNEKGALKESFAKINTENKLEQDELITLKKNKLQESSANLSVKEQSFDMDETEMNDECVKVSHLLVDLSDVYRTDEINENTSEHCNAKTFADHDIQYVKGSRSLAFESNRAALDRIVELQSLNETLRVENVELLNKLKEMSSNSRDLRQDVFEHREQNSHLQYRDQYALAEDTEIISLQHLSQVEAAPSTDQEDNKTEGKTESDLKDLLAVYQTELTTLKKQHSSDIAAWQEKLKGQTIEMETKLAAEKQHTEHIFLELEAARLELQTLDLSSRSFLAFDSDDVTKTFEAMNQTICTVLPMAKLSIGLDCSESSVSETASVVSKVETILDPLSLEKHGEKSRTSKERDEYSCSSTSNSSSLNNPSENTLSNLKIQTILENFKRQIQQTSGENIKLLKLVEDGERKVNSLFLQVEDLNKQIEQDQADLIGKENANTVLENKSLELENERKLLSEKVEFLSNEKLQLSSRVGDLEKELDNISNTMDMLKKTIDSLEIASGDWREKYLETENELRRSKSENANIEKHALSLEVDLDNLHSKYQHLQEENEGTLKSITALQERLNMVLTEKAQMNQEMDNMAEEKEEFEQLYQKLKEREKDLELHQINDREMINILEVEIRTLKVELQAAKSVSEQLSAEKESLKLLEESGKSTHLKIEELHVQLQQIEAEKQQLLKKLEELQIKLNEAYDEKHTLSKALECCQFEKREINTRLSSTQEEVALMRTGIEKLKVKIESDEKKKQNMIEKLKESGRSADKLKDRIESLERELLMSEENLEDAILQTEAAKEEVEKMKTQKEAFEIDLKTFRRKIIDLEKELQKSHEKIIELETTVATLSNTLEKTEIKMSHLEETEKEVNFLQTQLKELHDQKYLSDQRSEAAAAREVDLVSLMEQTKTQMLQQLEEAELNIRNLESSGEKMATELDEKTQYIVILENKVKSAEDLESKYYAELSHFETEQEIFRNEKANLQIMLDKLDSKVQSLSVINETLEGTVADLKSTCKDLEMQLESSTEEKVELYPIISEKEKLALELNECKVKLDEKTECILMLEDKVKEGEKLEYKYSAALSCFEADRETFITEKENLQNILNMLESKVQVISTTNNSYEITIADLRASCSDLRTQLETAAAEKTALLQKVEELEEKCTDLQSKLQEANLYIKTIQEEISLERKTCDERMQTVAQQYEESNAELAAMSSEKAETLTLELEQYKLKLDEKTKCILLLEDKVKDAEQLENKYSTELSCLEDERDTLIKEKENLQNMLETLKAKLQSITMANDSSETTIADLGTSCQDLQAQLESSTAEKTALLLKVGELEEKCTSLQCKLQDADLQVKTIQEEIALERTILDEKMQAITQQYQEGYAQLIAVSSENDEMKLIIVNLQLELEVQTKRAVEFQEHQLQIGSDQRSLLDDMSTKHKEDIQHYQEKLSSAEGLLNAHKHEIDCLKTSNGELAQSLSNAQRQLVEFNQLKTDIAQLKKENETKCNKLDHLKKSCKQLEHDKEQLQKHILKQEQASNDFIQKPKSAELDTSENDLISEMEELKQSLEEKTLEADETVEKYCTLLIKSHKLEDANDTLRNQIDFLNSKLKQYESAKEVSATSQPSETTVNNKRGLKNKGTLQGERKKCGKRQRGEDNSEEQKSTTPLRMSKRIRKTASNTKHTGSEEEAYFEPDGLPEIVKQGFSDIPSGKRSPFVLRRTALPVRTSPRLAAQSNSPSAQTLFKDNLENCDVFSSPAAGGSKAQMVKDLEATQLASDIRSMEISSPLSAHNRLKRTAPESPMCIGNVAKEKTNIKALHEESENEETCHVQ
ncbi:centromere protein F [Bombina bombina]|uniref:centromere protein F n=1 Tax=Bombina bombina TaxID=8345 RepID=UPI00235AFCB7|nr:centromere protein F [Bombina bombina]